MPPNTPAFDGLNSSEVAERIRRGESNDFEARVGRAYWEIARDNLLNLFNIVLFALLVIVLAFQEYTTAIFAGFSVVINSFAGMIQEILAKRSLDRLAALAAKEIRVWRDGRLTPVPAREIVIDDVIPLQPGDRVVVDGRVLRSDVLEMDEAHLTGESDAVFKEVDDPVHSGSFCVAGSGVIVATRVGKDSTINQLNAVAKAFKHELTPTQEKIASIVGLSVIVMLLVGPMILVTGPINNLPFLETIKNLVVFVTSLVPQGLVLAAIISLTYGAIAISRRNTLVQRVNAVESLANVTVLCFDKTGTVTRNQLAVTEIVPLNHVSEAEVCEKLHYYTNNLAHLNHTVSAIATYTDGIHANNQPVPQKTSEIPFNSVRKWGAVNLPDETLILGAPERVFCTASAVEAAGRAEELAEEGMRVLAFARSAAPLADGKLDETCNPLGLVVLSDQVREDIAETLAAFREQGIALKIISGDNLKTVRAIAAQAGLPTHNCYTGEVLEAMSDAELEAAVVEGDLFARVEPETKRRIIAALQAKGHYVAMVGDGVNDVPALKQANLAIAMNDGAQISKDVAEIVLLNNAMSTLPLAFHKGRRITQVMHGTIKLFVAKNLYSLLFILFTGFMMLPFPLNPIHMSWATLGLINTPATLIAIQWIHPQYMEKFRRDVLDYSITAGVIGGVSMTGLYVLLFLGTGRDVELARSAMLPFIVLFNALIFWNIHGIDLVGGRNIISRLPVFALGLALVIVTIAAPFIKPDLYQYTVPPLWVAVLITLTYGATIIGLSLNMRSRRLINRVWDLLTPG